MGRRVPYKAAFFNYSTRIARKFNERDAMARFLIRKGREYPTMTIKIELGRENPEF